MISKRKDEVSPSVTLELWQTKDHYKVHFRSCSWAFSHITWFSSVDWVACYSWNSRCLNFQFFWVLQWLLYFCLKVHSWFWKQQPAKQSDIRVHLVAVLEHLIKSHDLCFQGQEWTLKLNFKTPLFVHLSNWNWSQWIKDNHLSTIFNYQFNYSTIILLLLIWILLLTR